jgi:hypothetical protein
MFTYAPLQSLAQPAASTSALNVRGIPDDGSTLLPIDRTSSYLGVYYNTGPDLGEVLGPAATDQLRVNERDGRADVPVPTRKPALTGPAPSLTLPALSERSRGAWAAARREFTTARPARAGSSPGVGSPPASPPPPVYVPPRIKPDESATDTLKTSAPPDSVKKHPKHGAKPKPPKPPGEDAG